MEKVLSQAYPAASLKQNPHGKPKKGSFEVSLISGDDSSLIYSKLTLYGPKKDREALPDPVEFVINTLPSELSQEEKESKTNDDISSQNDCSEEESEEKKETQSELERLTVVKLRALLKERSLPTKGRKIDLIECLMEN